MSDIFISYSRKDSEQALELAERLQGEGMSVWIDQRGIEAAKRWSEEIVNAIEASKAFVLLLSSRSIESDNVARELALAFESQRPIVPIVIEDVALPAKFKYQLAGIQRVVYSQPEAITKALISCGVTITKSFSQKQDDRKSLLVMPFEDLSPTQDNLWFADGLAGELIDKLSHIQALRLVDRKTSRDLRSSTISIYEIANALQVRYVIEGNVRKFNDQIKISTSLLDVQQGDYLWQESHKGVMNDIFELQELVAEKAVEALRITLGTAESNWIEQRVTDDAKAYEFYLKGFELRSRGSRDNLQQEIQCYREAIKISPSFSKAQITLAQRLLDLFRTYDRSAALLAEAELTIDVVRGLLGESTQWFQLMASLLLAKGELTQAEEHARKALKLDPDDVASHDTLYFILARQERYVEAADECYEVAKREATPRSISNLLSALTTIEDWTRLRQLAKESIPVYETHLRLHPGDVGSAVDLARAYWDAGDSPKALEQAIALHEQDIRNGVALYNLACLFSRLGDTTNALSALKRAVGCGYNSLITIENDSDLEPLRALPEFGEIMGVMRSKALSVSDN